MVTADEKSTDLTHLAINRQISAECANHRVIQLPDDGIFSIVSSISGRFYFGTIKDVSMAECHSISHHQLAFH
jgi:hypothetical protein